MWRSSRAGRSRTANRGFRLYVIGVLAVATFLHAMTAMIRVSIDGTDYRTAVAGAHEVAHLLLIALSATLVALLAWHQFSRRGLAYIDITATMLVPCSGVIDMLVHGPMAMPEMPSLLLITLVLTGRAALVPSSTARTALVGLLALTPLAATAVLGDSLRTDVSGPSRLMGFIGVFGFGLPPSL